jgi:hypothetical protein
VISDIMHRVNMTIQEIEAERIKSEAGKVLG